MNKLKYKTRPIKPVVSLLVIIMIAALLGVTACSVPSVSQKKGIELYQAGDYDQAVEYFKKAFKDKPNSDSKVLLYRAQLGSYYNHLAKARGFKGSGKRDEAIKEYKIAISIFPNNTRLEEELNSFINGKKEAKPPFQTTIKPPVTLKVDPNEKIKSLRLRQTPITKIFNALGKSFGINFIFDKDFRDFPYTLEADNIGFYDALGQLCMVGGADYRVLDQTSVLIFPDNTFKKRTFGLRGLKVFYLSNTKAEDAKKLLMAVFREQQILIQEDNNLNTLIVKADYPTLVEVERFINAVDKKKSEVMLDVQILEVTQSLVQALGIAYAGGDASSPVSTVSGGETTTSSSSSTTTTSLNSTVKFSRLDSTSFFLTLPTAALSFLESDDNSRIIAKPNLRGVDGEEIKFNVGDEVAVPQTQFQAAAAGGYNNLPVTTYNYRKVGVDVKITPYIHKENEITLKVKLTVNSLTGYVNGFPNFGNRELETVIRLKEGETNIIGGFVKSEVTGKHNGFPGLSKIPLIGQLFGANGNSVKKTDIVLSITPQIINRVEITDEDESTIWSGSQNPASTGGGQVGHPDTSSVGVPDEEPQGAPRGGDSISIMPNKRRAPANQETYFTIRVNTAAQLSSLSFSGSISGAKANIEDLKADFFGGRNVQIMKDFSGSSFSMGFTFPDDRGGVNVVGQLRVKFLEKGNYQINLSGVNALTKDRKPVDLVPASAEIEVF